MQLGAQLDERVQLKSEEQKHERYPLEFLIAERRPLGRGDDDDKGHLRIGDVPKDGEVLKGVQLPEVERADDLALALLLLTRRT